MELDPRAAPVEVEKLEGGAFWRVVLNRPKANVLDDSMFEALTKVFQRGAEDKNVKAIALEGRGDHFSYGASVAEHLPDKVERMLGGFHRMLKAMLESSLVILAAVRGQCLGGGLELVSCCHRVFASTDARLGQPEIRLGVFPPVASVILPERVGRAAAEDLCLTGRIIDAQEALALGLVHGIADDPARAALSYAKDHLLALSSTSLRFAVEAGRRSLRDRFDQEMERVERIYLKELMATDDAIEGLKAFLEKRPPQWRNQ